VRFGFGMRQAALLVAISALALGGCGTLSGGLHGESLTAATAGSTDPDNPIAAALAPEQQPTGAVVEPHAGEQAMAATVAFRPASFELIRPGSQPSYMVASVGPLVVAQAPAWMLAQARAADPVVPSEGVLEEYDPWEPFNEKMFSFNYKLDKYVLKPVAKGYNFVMPDRLQQMIDSGFDNLLVVQRVVNNLLQGRPLGATAEVGRFLINSTVGIGGLFDIAKQEFNLQKTRADFGQTLGIWGIGGRGDGSPELRAPLHLDATRHEGRQHDQRPVAQPGSLPGLRGDHGRSLQRGAERLSPAPREHDQEPVAVLS